MKDKVRIGFGELMLKVAIMKQEVAEVQKNCYKRLLDNSDLDRFVQTILERKSAKAMIRSGAVAKSYAKNFWKPTTTVVRFEDGNFNVRRTLFAVKYGDDGSAHYWKKGELEIDCEGIIDKILRRNKMELKQLYDIMIDR